MSVGINSTGQVSVTNAATQIIGINGLRQGVLITNTASGGGATVYLGGSNAVTATTGHALPPGASISVPTASAVFGITASSTATVTFIEVF